MKRNKFVNWLLNLSNFLQTIGFILFVFFIGRFFSPMIQFFIYLIGGIITYVYIKLTCYSDLSDEEIKKMEEEIKNDE